MRRVKYFAGTCGIAIVLSWVALVRTQAQNLRPVHFGGVINDYSPSTVSGGPYEIRGDWSLDVVGGATASFSADLTLQAVIECARARVVTTGCDLPMVTRSYPC